MAARDVVATLEGTREAMLIEYVSSTGGCAYRSESFEARLVALPRSNRLIATPGQLFAAFTMMSGPERAVPLVETDDVINALKAAPGRPRRSLGKLVTQ